MVKLTDSIHLVGSGVAGVSAPTDANIYLIANGGNAVLVESGSGINSELLLRNIKETGVDTDSISMIVHTHSHWDHARGAHEMTKLLGAPVAMQEAGRRVLRDERFANHLVTKTGFEPPPPVEIDIALSDGDTFDIGSLRLSVIATPGHTADSLSFLLDDGTRRSLFTGDMVQGEGTLGAMWFDSDLVGYRDSLAKMVDAKPHALLPGHRMFTLANADAMLDRAVKSMTGTIYEFVNTGPAFAPSWWLANHKQEVAQRP
jgi:hydroxyacylglutathione hydrolase